VGKVTEGDVLEVIRTALKEDGVNVTAESKIGSVESWDSLGHLEILVALDQKFDGKVANIQEMAKADSVQAIVKILKKHALI